MDIRMIGLETFIPFLLFLRILFAMKYSKDTKLFFNLQKYAKLLCLEVIFVFLLVSCHSNNDIESQSDVVIRKELTTDSILTGAQQIHLLEEHLRNKNVALVGNQSSIITNEVHLVDTLLSLDYKLLKVFSPEHGFRGTASAGEHVSDSRDEQTGLPLVSLYGDHKKPTKEDLDGVDLLLFDIQDVGVRFYTYISTLHYVMEACAENNIPLIVLDRPNPNGDYIDGPVLEMENKSFVGMHPIPIVHGMTIGEYAQMINGEYWLKDSIQCKLTVIPCKNYSHTDRYTLPVPPSPNLKSDLSIRLYPSLCLFESTTVSVGRGTETPFEVYGHPDFPKSDFSFIPQARAGASKPKHENKRCYAFKPELDSDQRSMSLGFLLQAKKLLQGKSFINKKSSFIRLAGTVKLYDQIMSGLSESEIRETWKADLENFDQRRKKYLIYD